MAKQKEEKGLYHAKKKKGDGLCGVHAVNSLIGSQRYSKSDFDGLRTRMRVEMGLDSSNKKKEKGNYDANVLIGALRDSASTGLS